MHTSKKGIFIPYTKLTIQNHAKDHIPLGSGGLNAGAELLMLLRKA